MDIREGAPEPENKKKRRKPIPASALTKGLYEKLGWRIAFVERFIAPIRQRVDCFGFADHIAYKPGQPGFRFLNSCAFDRVADHRKSILANPRAYEILELDPNNRITIVAWERGKPGQGVRSKVEHVRLTDFANGKPPEPVKAPRKQRRKCRVCGKSDTRERPLSWVEDDLCFVCKHAEQPRLWRP